MRTQFAVRIAAATIASSATLLACVVGAQQNRRAADDANRACLSNLKQYAVGMMMYVQDYDETFPPMQTAKHVQNRLRPYVKRETVFRCPVTGQPYQPLKALSGKTLARIDAAKSPMLFDARAHPDGSEHTAYADGSVRKTKPQAGKTTSR